MRALELVGQALDRDPHYGSALAVAIGCQCSIYLSGWTNDLEATRKEGLDLARRALRLAGDDPFVLAQVEGCARIVATIKELLWHRVSQVERRRRAARDVEPTRSQNRMVRCLRSADVPTCGRD